MSVVFQNIDPHPPHRPASVYPPAFGAGGRTHSLGREGVGVKSSEDARHCSVLYICKYFVPSSHSVLPLSPSLAVSDNSPIRSQPSNMVLSRMYNNIFIYYIYLPLKFAMLLFYRGLMQIEITIIEPEALFWPVTSAACKLKITHIFKRLSHHSCVTVDGFT
jgi:hypothetical protein